MQLFDKKASFTANTTYNLQYDIQELTANVFNYQLAYRHQWKGQAVGKTTGSLHFALRMNWLQRFPVNNTANTINEWNFNLSLGYGF